LATGIVGSHRREPDQCLGEVQGVHKEGVRMYIR
jgi:hypothetical protein